MNSLDTRVPQQSQECTEYTGDQDVYENDEGDQGDQGDEGDEGDQGDDGNEEIDCGEDCVCDLRDRDCWADCFECLDRYFLVDEEGEVQDREPEENEEEEEDEPRGIDCEDYCDCNYEDNDCWEECHHCLDEYFGNDNEEEM